ncbi:hypothetical protein ABK040_002037 [Willaertia magna]
MPTLIASDIQNKHLSKLYNNQNVSDLIITTSTNPEQKYHVIKALLIPYSKVLENMLFGEFLESNQKEIILENISDIALELFLNLVYFGRIENRPLSDFIDLIVFAHEFQMEDLEEKCKLVFKEMEDCDIKQVEEDFNNLIKRIELYNDETNWIWEVKQSLIKIVTLNFEKFVKTNDFYQMSIENLLLLLELDIFCGSEDNLFENIVNWIKFDYKNRLNYIDDIIQRIDLTCLSKENLTTIDRHEIFSKSSILPTLLLEACKIVINPKLEDDNAPTVFKRRCYRKFSIKFTSLGCTGSKIPTELKEYYRGIQYLDNYVTLQNGIQYWTVPFHGKYKITSVGAGGGKNPSNIGVREGFGAKVSGYFFLSKGSVLKVLVGQKGEPAKGGTGGGAGGGGGASFVVLKENVSNNEDKCEDNDICQINQNTTIVEKPLIIGAGGNGQSWHSWTTSGPDGRKPIENQKETSGAAGARGGGGGGFKFDGMGGDNSGTGGRSFVNGGQPGMLDINNNTYGANGGFGGGGSANHEGGGGGGFVGGKVVPLNSYAQSYPEYGAISYNEGYDQENESGVNKDDGYVEITLE